MARYYDNANQAQRFQPGTTVRADEVDAKFDQVSSAFSDVETEVDRSLKLVNDGSDHEIAATATQRRNKVVGFDATGTMALLDGFTFRGDFTASTDYFVNDVIRDTTTKNLFVVDERHVSGSTRDDSKMSLAIDVDDVEAAKDAAKASEDEAEAWATKTDGDVETGSYSSKAYAIGGVGIDGSIGSAKDWAIKTNATVDGTNFSAKYWATDTNVTTVASNIGDINTVATDIADVSSVSAEIGQGKDVTIVADDLSGTDTVGTVADSIIDVNTVAGELGAGQDVTVVAADIANVETVATDITNVNTVATNVANVNTTATNISNVNNVAAELGAGKDVTIVASNLESTDTIGTVAASIANVNIIAGINADVTAVANIDTDVTTVSGISANVTTVATNDTNVTTVANNIADVSTAADNIVAIQNAPQEASDAADSATAASNSETAAANSASAALSSENDAASSATKARQFAEFPEDSEVEPGEFSAKHYSLKAAASAAASDVPTHSAKTDDVHGVPVGERIIHTGDSAFFEQTNAAIETAVVFGV